ncbi:MAG: cation transporter [Clostridia bacterium]|nr:cation transporter [Clostridia bacterium]
MTKLLIKKFVKGYKNTGNPAVRSAYGKLAGLVGIVCNTLLFILKIIIGTISGSVSITADAANNLSDASSSIISLLGFKLAEKPADTEHPYGHGRYEYLSALTIAVFIIVIGIELFRSGIDKIINPEKVSFSFALIAVLGISILLKLWMMFFNRYTGRAINSKSILATAADSRNDVITTSAVLASSLISHYTDFELDGFAGVGIAIFILVSGVGLIKDTINPMLGSAPEPSYVQHIAAKILSYPGVLGLHDLMIHDYGPCRKFASVHVEMAAEEDPIESHDLIDNIETDFLKDENLHLIVHYDPILTKDPLTNDIRKQIENTVHGISQFLSIHDLRIVPGTTHTNLVFDCISPYEAGFEDKELKEEICRRVKELNPKYNCVITIDKSYVSAE